MRSPDTSPCPSRVRVQQAFFALLLTPLALIGCFSVPTVRSAEVMLGPSLHQQLSFGTPPGRTASALWGDDYFGFSSLVPGIEGGLAYGWRPEQGPAGVAVTVGASGLLPYVDGYLQLREGRRPFGVGARVGIPVDDGSEHQLYGRYDVPLSASTRLLLNPGIVIRDAGSVSGESGRVDRGSFVGFMQGVGVMFEGTNVTWTPSLGLVAGRAEYRAFSFPPDRQAAVYATFSLGVTYHRRRPARD